MIWFNRALLPARDRRVSGTEPLHPLELLKHRELRHVLIATALISMSWDLQTFVIPVHGTRVGLSAAEIGFVLGSFALATFTIRLAMPRLSRRFTEWQVLTYTLFCATLAFGLFPLFSSLVPLIAVAFLLGLGLGAAQPNVMSLVHSRSPQGRVGEALGCARPSSIAARWCCRSSSAPSAPWSASRRCSGRWRRWCVQEAWRRCDGESINASQRGGTKRLERYPSFRINTDETKKRVRAGRPAIADASHVPVGRAMANYSLAVVPLCANPKCHVGSGRAPS